MSGGPGGKEHRSASGNWQHPAQSQKEAWAGSKFYAHNEINSAHNRNELVSGFFPESSIFQVRMQPSWNLDSSLVEPQEEDLTKPHLDS